VGLPGRLDFDRSRKKDEEGEKKEAVKKEQK